MTQVSRIKFDAKYRISYMNGSYSLSGFDHIKSIQLDEYELNIVLEMNIEDFKAEEWYDFVELYPELQDNLRGYEDD